MKPHDRAEKVVRLARVLPQAGTVPYAFEKRIMAAIRARPALVADVWSEWSRALWKAAAPCLGIMLFMCAWNVFDASQAALSDGWHIAELESTIIAPLDLGAETW